MLNRGVFDPDQIAKDKASNVSKQELQKAMKIVIEKKSAMNKFGKSLIDKYRDGGILKFPALSNNKAIAS